MPAAEAAPVLRIEAVAAVSTLDDVVREEAARSGDLAALSLLDPLAAPAGATLHLDRPGPVLRRLKLGVGHLWWRFHRAGVDRPEPRPDRLQRLQFALASLPADEIAMITRTLIKGILFPSALGWPATAGAVAVGPNIGWGSGLLPFLMLGLPVLAYVIWFELRGRR